MKCVFCVSISPFSFSLLVHSTMFHIKLWSSPADLVLVLYISLGFLRQDAATLSIIHALKLSFIGRTIIRNLLCPHESNLKHHQTGSCFMGAGNSSWCFWNQSTWETSVGPKSGQLPPMDTEHSFSDVWTYGTIFSFTWKHLEFLCGTAIVLWGKEKYLQNGEELISINFWLFCNFICWAITVK